MTYNRFHFLKPAVFVLTPSKARPSIFAAPTKLAPSTELYVNGKRAYY